MNSLMIAVSMGLQYGVPPEVYVSKLSHMRFEPSGMTNDEDIRIAKSIVDYIFRWFGKKFLTVDQQEEVGILSTEVKARMAANRQRRAGRCARCSTAEPPAPARRRCSTRTTTQSSARVRRPDDPNGQLLHVPRLRHEHRLQLASWLHACACLTSETRVSARFATSRPKGRFVPRKSVRRSRECVPRVREAVTALLESCTGASARPAT